MCDTILSGELIVQSKNTGFLSFCGKKTNSEIIGIRKDIIKDFISKIKNNSKSLFEEKLYIVKNNFKTIEFPKLLNEAKYKKGGGNYAKKL